MAIPTGRKPTGAMARPFLLLEGPQSSGKTWQLINLSRSPRVGRTWVIQFGEVDHDQYGQMPGARHEIFDEDDHGNTWLGFMDVLDDLVAGSREVKAAGEKPPVLGVDSATPLWDYQKAVVDRRVRNSKKGRELLAVDPDADVDAGHSYWNPVKDQWAQFLAACRAFQGIVVLTARLDVVTEMDENGRPTRRKTLSPQIEKTTPYAVGAIIRLTDDQPPQITGLNSFDPELAIVPGKSQPRYVPDLTLERFIFDYLKWDPDQTAPVARLLPATAKDILGELRSPTLTRDGAMVLYKRAERADLLNQVVPAPDGSGERRLSELIVERGKALAATEQAAATPDPGAAETGAPQTPDRVTVAGETTAAAGPVAQASAELVARLRDQAQRVLAQAHEANATPELIGQLVANTNPQILALPAAPARSDGPTVEEALRARGHELRAASPAPA